jgi:CRP-like cAMP-binding protein
MGFFEASFEIIEEKDCPMQYCRGDHFYLSGLAFSAPKDKATCLFLAREVTELMIRKLGEQQFFSQKEGRTNFNCSGCTGLIKLQLKKKDEGEYATLHMRMLAKADSVGSQTKDIESLSSMLNSFSIFQVLDDQSITDLMTYVKVKSYNVDETVIQKGDESKAVYMILTGQVEVRDNEKVIAYLGRGEIFGEMSMLTGNPVGATISVVEPAKVLSIRNEQFRHMLVQYPAIQMNITKILAQRLNATNLLKMKEVPASFSGRLSEIPIAELCQFLNNNSKTGSALLETLHGEGVISFLNGEMVRAQFKNYTETKAFYEILKESEGSFTFTPGLSDSENNLPPIGSFMNLLMEGLQKIDEGKDSSDE